MIKKRDATILQVLPRMQSGGVERGTIEITDAITKDGMRAIVASAGGQLIPHITHAGGTHITLPLDSKKPWVIWKNAMALHGIIKAQKVDIIHARSRAPAWSAYFAAKWAGIPLVTTFHGIYGLQGPLKKRYNSVMVRGKRVIAVSEFVKHHILKNYAVDSDKITLIPRGVDFRTFAPDKVIPERLIQLTKQWRIPDEPRKIIFCPGRLSRIKGQHYLLEALTALKDIPFLCILCGSDQGHESYREELETIIRASNLEGSVRITEATNFMTEAYTLADIVVVPSLKPESFGRVAVEAQAMGKLVVATDHGGARETIIANETGYLVPTDKPEILTEAIRFGLTREQEVIHAMGEFAIAHVREKFSVGRMKNATITLYHDMLSYD